MTLDDYEAYQRRALGKNPFQRFWMENAQRIIDSGAFRCTEHSWRGDYPCPTCFPTRIK